ncbi:hypothetical protein S83_063916, partial [Arachis hypogaea]
YEQDVLDYVTNMAPLAILVGVTLLSGPNIHLLYPYMHGSSLEFQMHWELKIKESYEQYVLDYVTNMTLYMVPFKVGIAIGCGWQKLGTYVNLGAYYVLEIPIAIILDFWVQLRVK